MRPTLKMVLREPPEWKNSYIDVILEKEDDDNTIAIYHGDNRSLVAKVTCTRETRNLQFTINTDEGARVVVEGVVLDPEKASNVKVPKKFPKQAEGARCWKKETRTDPDTGAFEEVFIVSLPNGNFVELPVVDPGPMTPTEYVHEIVGQDEMLFTICLAISLGKNTLLTGPTGVGKTTVYRWLAKQLGYNLVIGPITRGTQDRHMSGEYAPAGPGDFRWMDGFITMAVRASQKHPTILLLDELNRIGNVAEFARCYSVLDDTRMIELAEKRTDTGEPEILRAGRLFIGATANPVDDDNADYVGVRELDPAFQSRLPFQPRIKYPTQDMEARALCDRVATLDKAMATMMVAAANKIRESTDVRWPMSFRELEAWALALPYFGFKDAAELTVVSKAPHAFRPAVRTLLGVITDNDIQHMSRA
jgi:MoxR-like ATPase